MAVVRQTFGNDAGALRFGVGAETEEDFPTEQPRLQGSDFHAALGVEEQIRVHQNHE